MDMGKIFILKGKMKYSKYQSNTKRKAVLSKNLNWIYDDTNLKNFREFRIKIKEKNNF